MIYTPWTSQGPSLYLSHHPTHAFHDLLAMATTTLIQASSLKVERAPVWDIAGDSPSGMKKQHGSVKEDLRRSVRIALPDLFTSFLAREPNINPLYGKISKESADWLAECGS